MRNFKDPVRGLTPFVDACLQRFPVARAHPWARPRGHPGRGGAGGLRPPATAGGGAQRAAPGQAVDPAPGGAAWKAGAGPGLRGGHHLHGLRAPEVSPDAQVPDPAGLPEGHPHHHPARRSGHLQPARPDLDGPPLPGRLLVRRHPGPPARRKPAPRPQPGLAVPGEHPLSGQDLRELLRPHQQVGVRHGLRERAPESGAHRHPVLHRLPHLPGQRAGRR